MNDCNMRRNVDAAVFLCRGKAEHVVILVNRTTYCTKCIVAVCQDVRDRELFHTGCLGCLDNPYKGNIMGCHAVKTEF